MSHPRSIFARSEDAHASATQEFGKPAVNERDPEFPTLRIFRLFAIRGPLIGYVVFFFLSGLFGMREQASFPAVAAQVAIYGVLLFGVGLAAALVIGFIPGLICAAICILILRAGGAVPWFAAALGGAVGWGVWAALVAALYSANGDAPPFLNISWDINLLVLATSILTALICWFFGRRLLRPAA